MSISCVATALIVTPDSAASSILGLALRSVAIDSRCCSTEDECLELVSHQRFEVVFLDFDTVRGTLTVIRSSSSSRSSVLVALTANARQASEAFAEGVHFTIEQPVSRSSADAIIRAAYGLIIREKRRSFRCPMDVDILAHRENECAWPARARNISEGGMCIVAPIPLNVSEFVAVEFMLPHSSVEIRAQCNVQWATQDRRAGLQFISLPKDRKPDLLHWLSEQLDRHLQPLIAFTRVPTVGVVPTLNTLRAQAKKLYEKPKVSSYHSVEHIPTKLRVVAEDILNDNPLLRVEMDEQRRSISFSEEFARLLGYSSRDLVGRSLEEITSQGAVDIDFIFKVLGRIRESRGLWLFDSKSGNKLLCAYRARVSTDRVVAEFTPLLMAV